MSKWNDLIAGAMEFAAEAHAGHMRKATNIPYIVHPFETAMILKENGMTEEVMAAGLLHDVLEDTGVSPEDIKVRFGEEILELVIGASERLENRDNTSWKERKAHTVDYLKKEASFQVKAIACADKLSNIRSMLRNIDKTEDKAVFWNRFNAGKEKQEWYFNSLLDSLGELEGLKMYQEFVEAVDVLFG